GFRKALFAVAERNAPKARHGLEVFLAAVVVEIDALSLRDDRRPDRQVLVEVGGRMDDVLDVAGVWRVRQEIHDVVLGGGAPGRRSVGMRQRPLKVGLRFSLKAATPSLTSSLSR